MSKFKKLKAFLFVVSLSFLLAHTAYAGSYTVVTNDSLYKIGTLFNTTASSIAKTNNLSSTTLYPGQVLNIPCTVYTVKNGDTLYLIAKRYGIDLYSLRKANNKWDNGIYPGQKLNLPGITSSGTQSNTSKSIIPYTSSELDLLARLITAEAGGEPYTAQVGVGAVVINRVKDAKFPNSISGVIYQKDSSYYQFTPVENGWINKPASQEANSAAYDALHGSDPTYGALYYFDNSSTNKWLWSKPIALISGKMVFVY